MAMYDYACTACAGATELSRRIADRDDTAGVVCGACGATDTMVRQVGSPLVGYSTTVPGSYGRKIPDGFKEVLNRIHSRAPGSRLDKASTFM